MILGIDIGGTTTKIGLVDNTKIIKRYVIDTNPSSLINDLIESFKMNNINLEEIHAIGCAIPGFINHITGVITLSGNLGYKDYSFKEEFESKLGKPIFVVNDANAAALGEYWVGAGEEYNSTILYTLGTGVGGGIIVNNNLIFGAHGYAGELGHGGNFQNQRDCSCGLKGCIEPMSSAVGITKTLISDLGETVTLKDVTQRFLNGDKKVIDSFKKSLTPLANHIAIMETALNPDAIIIGGGPSNYGKPLSDLISELVSEVQLDFISDVTPILIATTKNDAGILGAAYWALTEEAKIKANK